MGVLGIARQMAESVSYFGPCAKAEERITSRGACNRDLRAMLRDRSYWYNRRLCKRAGRLLATDQTRIKLRGKRAGDRDLAWAPLVFVVRLRSDAMKQVG